MSATLTGPGVVGAAVQTTFAGTAGQVQPIWTVNVSGTYSVIGIAGTSQIGVSTTVS